MQITLTVDDAVGQSYAAIYGHSADSKLTVEEFIADSLTTYLENAHVGHQIRAAEAAAREPFATAQAERAERAAPPKPEPVEEAAATTEETKPPKDRPR